MDDALKIEPDNVMFLDFKGNTLVEIGKLTESFNCFEKITQIDPNNARAWYNKGTSLMEHVNPYDGSSYAESKMDEAIECFEKVLEIDPNNARAWYNKGTSCIAVGRAEEGATCLEKTMEIDSTVLKKAHFPKDS
jgi:tetratricopeptide (TPR) repeat protein